MGLLKTLQGYRGTPALRPGKAMPGRSLCGYDPLPRTRRDSTEMAGAPWYPWYTDGPIKYDYREDCDLPAGHDGPHRFTRRPL